MLRMAWPICLLGVSSLVCVPFPAISSAVQQAESTTRGAQTPGTNPSSYADDVGNGHRIEIRSTAQEAPYLRKLLAQLKKSWLAFIPNEAGNGRPATITAVFEILPDGRLSADGPRIEASSGSPELDQAALYAIRYWKKYDRLPSGFLGSSLTVHADFSYNVGTNTRVEVPATGTVSGKLSRGGYGAEILSDTQGVDFKAYIDRMLAGLKQSWSDLIPEEAKMGQKGRTYVTIEIRPDGSLPPENVQLERASGTGALDKAALAAVNNSAPFEALPSAFHGPYLKLRIAFLYNMKPEDAGLGTGKE